MHYDGHRRNESRSFLIGALANAPYGFGFGGDIFL